MMSSLRKKRHPAARDANGVSGDGWMHGGRYVPSSSSGRRGGSDELRRDDAADRAVLAESRPPDAATAVGDQPSPLSALLPGLNTPLPTPEVLGWGRRSKTPEDGGRDGRTPLTERLQRLLFDTTPGARTPAHSTSTSTRSSVPATPVGRFLESSGVPSPASRAVGDASAAFTDLLGGLFVVLWEELVDWWRFGFASRRPDLASGCEAVFDLISEVLGRAVAMLVFAMPYVAWVLQTCIALALMVGGTLFYGLVVLVRGDGEAASRDGADALRNSAVKSLRRNMSHSPFFRRTLQKDVPFTAFKSFKSQPDERGHGAVPPAERATPPAAVQAGSVAVSNGQSRQQRTTPAAASAVRPISSILKQTPHNNNGRSNPPSRRSTPSTGDSSGKTPSRRVLFTETECGQVSTTQFCYDKHLPPSARKVQRDDAVAAMGLAAGRAGSTPFARPQPTQQRRDEESPGNLPRPSVDARSALSPQVAQPPAQPPAERPGVEASPGGAAESLVPTARPQVRRQKPPAASEGDRTEEERKRQYVERYGLLPSITPLSRKYARSLRQQPNARPIGGAADRSFRAAAAANASDGNKRKRRGDLLGAASRLGRSRRARLTAAGGAAFRNGPTRKRSHGDVTMSRTDQAVWRAMNGVDKENNGPEESARKRGKFADAAGAAKAPGPQPEVLGTPKRTPVSSSSTTPPKTPGPFSLNASATVATPGKTPAKGRPTSTLFGGQDGATEEAPSISAPTPAKTGRRNEESAAAPSAGLFSFGGDDSSAPSSSTQPASGSSFKFGGGDSSAPSTQSANGSSFKFGGGADGPATTAAPSSDQPDAPGQPAFSFGGGSGAQTAGDDKPPKSSGFSFQAPAAFNSAPAAGGIAQAPTDKAAAAAPSGRQPAFAFGAAPTPADAASVQAPTGSSFQFGQQAAIENKPQNSASGFSFQAPGQSNPVVAKKTSTAQPSPGFSFGAPAETAPSATAAPQTFSFGQQAAKPAAGGAFAFGATATQAPSAAAPAFSFGGATAPNAPNFGALGAPASTGGFNLGGGTTATSEASARRRAKKSGNRRR